MGRAFVFVAGPDDAGTPLGLFLRGRGLSAGSVKAVKYHTEGFMVNQIPRFTNYPLQEGDEITFRLPDDEIPAAAPETIPLEIVYQSELVVVVNKPAGMAVHPSLTVKNGTLANAWAGLMAQKGQTLAFRPVNRLDKNTSGLVICAKDAHTAALLQQNFDKSYLAVCVGEMPLGFGVVDAPISRQAGSIIKRCVSAGADAKPSVTQYNVLKAAGGYSLVSVQPQTGRTHQIRVHMAHIGHPLAGDTLYGADEAMPRHALHCAYVGFDAGKGRVDVSCPLPEDMAFFCERVGLQQAPNLPGGY